MTTADALLEILHSLENEAQRNVLVRFFKCGEGEYGEGDKFLGLKVPQTRSIVREARLDVPVSEIARLLDSPWHEARLCGLLLLVEEMKAATPRRRESPTLH
ncbi:MAG: DNA alkylation repair protein, partial [Duncaniella sp.]|nr:DNA alkylation repair protein [Duncaniella sp.]